MKRVLISLLAVSSILLILAALILFLPPAFRIGLRAANRFLPVTLSVSEYHHVPGELRISGIQVTTPRATLGEMTSLEIEYRPLTLFLGRLEIATLHLEAPEIVLQRSEDGRIDPFGLPPGREPEDRKGRSSDDGSWTAVLAPLHVREVRISEASIRFEDLATGYSMMWDGVDMEGDLSGDPLRGELHLSEGLLEVSKGTASTWKAKTEGRASLREGRLSVTELQLVMDESRIVFNGGYSLEGETVDLKAELETVPLGRILKTFGVQDVQVDDLSGTLEADGEPGAALVMKADLGATAYRQKVHAQLAGSLQEERILIESIRIRNPEASLTGRASWDTSSGRLGGELDLKSSLLEETFRPYGFEDLKVRELSVGGRLDGTVQNPELGLQVRFEELLHRSPILSGFSAEGGIGTERGVHLEGKAESVPLLGEAGGPSRMSASLHRGVAECEIRADPSLNLRGKLNLEDRNAELSVQARQLSLSFLVKERIHSSSTLSLTGSGSFRGSLDRAETWTGKADIDTLRLSLLDLDIRTARPASVRVEQGRVHAEAALKARESEMDVRGSFPLEDQGEVNLAVTGALSLEQLHPAARHFLPALEAWHGDLRINGNLRGPVGAPRIRAVAELPDASLRLVFAEQELREESMEDGNEGKGETEEQLHSQAIVAEGIQANLDLEGPLTAPSGSLNLSTRQGALYGESLDKVQLQAESRNGRIWNPQLEIRRGKDRLFLQGRWEIPTGKLSGSIQSTELDLSTLLQSRDLPLRGSTELEGTIDGTTESPQVRIRATASSLVIQDTPVGDVQADLGYEPDRLTARAESDAGWLDVAVHLKGKRTFSLRGAIDAFPMGPLLEKVKLRAWTGTASLSGNLTGPITEFERWKGEISLEKVDLRAGSAPIRLAGPVNLGFRQGTLTLPETSLIIEDSALRVQGTLGPASRLTLRGTLPLVPFASLFPGVRFDTARAEADLTVSGTLDDPALDGTLGLEAGQVKLGVLGYPVDSLRAELRANANRFTLVSLEARMGDGSIDGSGSVRLDPLSFDDLRLNLEAVPVRLSDDLAARLRGELLLRGTRERSLLQGDLRIIEARYEEDFDLVGMVLRPSRPSQSKVETPDPLLRNMRLDLNINSGPDLIVRNNMARVILSTDMDIRGSAATPVPLGVVKVEEGRIYFSKKQFDITQGTLSFIDPQGGPPNLQLESMVEVQGTTRDYTIYLSFTGPLDRIQLELRSVPDLEREDILFMLVTGKTRDEFYASTSEEADTEETAQRLALSGLGFLIGSDVREMTGLDTFELERTEGEDFGVKTTVGKQFNERIEVRGIFALGSGQQVSEAQVGYLLTDMFYVVGTQRTDGSFGLDFRIRLGSR